MGALIYTAANSGLGAICDGPEVPVWTPMLRWLRRCVVLPRKSPEYRQHHAQSHLRVQLPRPPLLPLAALNAQWDLHPEPEAYMICFFVSIGQAVMRLRCTRMSSNSCVVRDA